MRRLAALILGFCFTACSSSSPTVPSALLPTPSATPTSVAIVPSDGVVPTGGVSQLHAIVSPGGASQGVAWSVTGTGCSNASCGTIDATGKYTAPATAPNPATVTVTARSVADSTKSSDKTITIVLLSGPLRTFVFDHGLTNVVVHDYTRSSFFILYDNGAFLLKYPTVAGNGYVGAYTVSNGVVAFVWQGWGIAGPWTAAGTLQGNSLTVNYDTIMQLTDFEDAAYTLQP